MISDIKKDFGIVEKKPVFKPILIEYLKTMENRGFEPLTY